jgi:syntaxin 1B/2/3
MRNKLKRFLGLYKREATDDDLEKLCDDPEAAKKLMQEQVVGTAHSKVQSAVSDIQSKYKQILMLEQSVNELLELFTELALIIEKNGETIDRVGIQFQEA